jgi:hypothetical protein
MSWVRWIPSALLLLPWLIGPLAPSNTERIRDVSGGVSFRLLDWETVALASRAQRLIGALVRADEPTLADVETLRSYFAPKGHDAATRLQVEVVLERVVGDAYRRQGVSKDQPIGLGTLFPPVLVALTPPPNVLVISPRNELRVIDSSVLQPMRVAAQEELEASADSNNVSSLIAPIGGLATYPSMVLDDESAERVLSSVAHEWLHQYLIFYPLGAGYWNSQQTREINETAAEMIGNEVGGTIARELELTPATRPAAEAPRAPAFDFRAFMRETRVQTEELLRQDRVDDAEAYMRGRRDEMQQHGYQIRKLNQAYFALYGSYGEGFAASPSNPIPGLLHTLRERSASLGAFIARVRSITTVDELRQAAG